jgi:hypothetical protein
VLIGDRVWWPRRPKPALARPPVERAVVNRKPRKATASSNGSKGAKPEAATKTTRKTTAGKKAQAKTKRGPAKKPAPRR